MQTYRVVMKGLKQGVAREDAEPLLAATFHIGVDQVRILLAQVPVKVKSAVAYDRAMEYQHLLDHAGGDCAVEADPCSNPPEGKPGLQTVSGHSVIEDGIAISQFEYEPPVATQPSGLRSLTSWLAARVGRVQAR